MRKIDHLVDSANQAWQNSGSYLQHVGPYSGSSHPNHCSLATSFPDTQDTTSLPDCNARVNEFNYSHYNPSDDHFTMLYNSNGTMGRVTASHRLTTAFSVLAYEDYKFIITNNNTGVTTCSFFKVDLTLSVFFQCLLYTWGRPPAVGKCCNLPIKNAVDHFISTSQNCKLVLHLSSL